MVLLHRVGEREEKQAGTETQPNPSSKGQNSALSRLVSADTPPLRAPATLCDPDQPS